MKPSILVTSAAFALTFASTMASAQLAPVAAPPARPVTLSKEAFTPIKELEAAVAAKDAAAIALKLAAAQAAAKTPNDRLAIAQLQVRAGIAANDLDAIEAGIAAMAATGVADPAALPKAYLYAGEERFKAKQYDQAAVSLERVLALEPTNIGATTVLAETRIAQGRGGEAAPLIQKAIRAQAATGVKPEEKLYRRLVAVALKANLPETLEASRQWVAAYPTSENWRDALRIYRQVAKPDPATTLDTLRLARVTKALEGNDYPLYVYEATDGGTGGEAKTVLAEAIAAKAIDPAGKIFKEVDRPVRMAAAGESANLAAKTSKALSGTAAPPLLAVGDSHFGRGDYAKAVELYRAALTKSGANADRINLHLGMALARQGDKAGAIAAFSAVKGAQAELAKYWLVYAATLP